MEKTKALIVECLTKNPNIDVKTIEKETKISKTDVWPIIRGMIETKEITVFQKNPKTAKMFSLAGVSLPSVEKAIAAKAVKEKVNTMIKQATSETAEVAEPVIKITKAEKTKATKPKNGGSKTDKPGKDKPATEENSEGKNFGRDFSKYKFDGQEYRKGKLVLAIVKRFVSDNPGCSFKKLHETFPDDLVKNYGVFTDFKRARKANEGGKVRYQTQSDQKIVLKDGDVAVTNQIGKHNIDGIIAVAKKLGYKISGS